MGPRDFEKFEQTEPLATQATPGQASEPCFNRPYNPWTDPSPPFQDEKYGARKRTTQDEADIAAKKMAKAANVAMDKPNNDSKINCSVCCRFFSRCVMLPLRPWEHDWRERIQICFQCARNTTEKTTDQPWIPYHMGMAIDDGPGTDTLMADRFPVISPTTHVMGWS